MYSMVFYCENCAKLKNVTRGLTFCPIPHQILSYNNLFNYMFKFFSYLCVLNYMHYRAPISTY